MPSVVPGFEYDIFISYRQNDNQSDQWVTSFVNALREEIKATFKEDISIYFDENPHDGLHEHHEVDSSLKEKLKCLILIPIVSQTYCDPKAFAWEHEFKVFIEQGSNDQFGLKTKLSGGNVANRVLPIRIHDLGSKDISLFESEIGSVMRSIDFIYQETGVNRPLRANEENPSGNQNQTFYRNQVNKVANAIKDILGSLSNEDLFSEVSVEQVLPESGSKEDILAAKPKKKKVSKIPTQSLTSKFRQLKTTNLWQIIAIVAIILFGLSYWPGFKSQPEPEKAQVIRYPILLPLSLGRTGRQAITLSNNGEYICYSANEQLYLKSTKNPDAGLPIAGTEGSRHPFFSPDGNWIGFENFNENGLYMVPLQGGSAQKICDLEGGSQGINWYDNEILFGQNAAIYSVSATGGTPERIYPLEDSIENPPIWNPQLLPDKSTILFNKYSQAGFWEVRLWKLNSEESATILIDRGTDARYLSSGHIAYIDAQRLYIIEFDLKSLTVKGKRQIVATEPIPNSGSLNKVAQYAFSENGILAYYSGEGDLAGRRHVVWIDHSGNIEQITRGDPKYFYSPKVSPDGQQIAVDVREGNLQLEIVNNKLGIASVFVNQGDNYTPIWSPDNTTITYSVESNNKSKIYEKPINLSYEPKLLLELDGPILLGNWSRDGRYLVLEFFSDTGSDIGYFDKQDSAFKTLDFINSNKDEILPLISPDGKWLAYTSNKDGSNQVYVVPFPGPGQEYRVSVDQGISPVWAPDMKALYFIGGGVAGSNMWEAKIQTEPQFFSEEPTALFKGSYYRTYDSGPAFGRFDVHPDGDRFLMVQNAAESEIANQVYEIQMVVNWQQDIINQ